MIFFIYNIRRTTSPGADRGVGSPQSFHTILVLTLNYHVFLTTVAFRNTYPNQPYTSHALHAFFGSNGPYYSVLRIHFTTRVAPTMVRREHNKGVSKFQVDTYKEIDNTTTLSLARKEWLWYQKWGNGTQRWRQKHSCPTIIYWKYYESKVEPAKKAVYCSYNHSNLKQ